MEGMPRAGLGQPTRFSRGGSGWGPRRHVPGAGAVVDASASAGRATSRRAPRGAHGPVGMATAGPGCVGADLRGGRYRHCSLVVQRLGVHPSNRLDGRVEPLDGLCLGPVDRRTPAIGPRALAVARRDVDLRCQPRGSKCARRSDSAVLLVSTAATMPPGRGVGARHAPAGGLQQWLGTLTSPLWCGDRDLAMWAITPTGRRSRRASRGFTPRLYKGRVSRSSTCRDHSSQ